MNWNKKLLNCFLEHSVNIDEKDTLFGFDCLDYLIATYNGHNYYFQFENPSKKTIFDLFIKSNLKENEIIKLIQKFKINIKKEKNCIFTAAEKGFLNLLKFFTDSNVDTDFRILHYAASCKNNNTKMIKLLIARGLNVNVRNQKEATPLHTACKEGNLENVNTLLDLGAQLDALDFDKNTALHYSSKTSYNNAEIIKLMIANGLNVNSQNVDGETPLHLACKEENLENVVALLDLEAKCDIVDFHENSALHYSEHNSVIIKLMVANGLNVNAQNKDRATPLHLACRNVNLENLVTLLDLGARCDIVDLDQNTPLHYLLGTCDLDYSEIIKLMVANGLNVHAQNAVGATVLHLACEAANVKNVVTLFNLGARCDIPDLHQNTVLHYLSKHSYKDNSEIIKFMVANGLNVNAKNQDGATPLHLAFKKANLENAQTLLNLGARYDIVDLHQNTALHYSSQAYKDNTEIIKFLVKNGFNVNVKNEDGATPLHVACKKGILENVETLLELEARCDILDLHRNTALHYSSHTYNNNSEIIELMIANGLDVNAQNEDRATPLHIACENGELKNVKTLVDFGARLDILDYKQYNVLHYATKTTDDNDKIIQFLLTKGVDINAQNIDGKTPLDVASDDNRDFVKSLLK